MNVGDCGKIEKKVHIPLRSCQNLVRIRINLNLCFGLCDPSQNLQSCRKQNNNKRKNA